MDPGAGNQVLDLSRLNLSCELLDAHVRQLLMHHHDTNDSNDNNDMIVYENNHDRQPYQTTTTTNSSILHQVTQELPTNNRLHTNDNLSPANNHNDEQSSGEILDRQQRSITRINASHNKLGNRLPTVLFEYFSTEQLTSLDLSDNSMYYIDARIIQFPALVQLNLSNNNLTEKSFPSKFAVTLAKCLQTLVLSGNNLAMIPNQLFQLTKLESLYLGGNKLRCLPKEVAQLSKLKVLYLGGNQLKYVAQQVGHLRHLEALALCDNQLETLPSSISRLVNLRSLALHNNNLKTLPQDIVKLDSLIEDIAKTRLLSLLELSARAIKAYNIVYTNQEPGPSGASAIQTNDPLVPKVLVDYLNSACKCVNPKCKGLYISSFHY
ncbi:Leucine-rich repeat-containing protein 58, partial [Fragariocoptes setiger]